MKKGTFYLLVGFLAINSFAFGQDYAFKVLANKGANEVKSGDAWQALKTGASLKVMDELKVSENGYLGLVSSGGQPVEIRAAGAYKVKDLADRLKGDGKTVLNKYTEFILSSNSAEAKKNRLSATGAVHRGLEDIRVFLPLNQHASLFNPTIIINWETKSTGPFVVTLKNMWDDELVKVETPEMSINVSLTDPKFANESSFLVEVKSKADANSKSDQHLIKKLPPDEQSKIKKGLEEIGGTLKEETALNELILAGFYEDHDLLIDAITAYERAIKLAPDVPTYKEAYEEFLLRNKLKSVK